MIKVIYGEKGNGKTKRLVGMANEAQATAKGSSIFISDNTDNMYDLNNQIRFININEYEVKGPKMFSGFLFGLAATDFDLENIFVDGFTRVVKHDIFSLNEMFELIEKFSDDMNITIILSVTGDSNNIPEYIKKYLM